VERVDISFEEQVLFEFSFSKNSKQIFRIRHGKKKSIIITLENLAFIFLQSKKASVMKIMNLMIKERILKIPLWMESILFPTLHELRAKTNSIIMI